MYIMSDQQYMIINADAVERFLLVPKPDAALIIASYSQTASPVTIARYKTKEEAAGALHDLFLALAGDMTYFYMPLSTYAAEGPRVHDARTRRHGGS